MLTGLVSNHVKYVSLFLSSIVITSHCGLLTRKRRNWSLCWPSVCVVSSFIYLPLGIREGTRSLIVSLHGDIFVVFLPYNAIDQMRRVSNILVGMSVRINARKHAR